MLGPACESVLGLEVVTADGEQIYCDPENHPDMYWAARGSGPGFFGVVTSFRLRVYPTSAVWGTCLYMYSDSRSPTRCSPGHARSFPSSTTELNSRSTPRAAFRRPGSTSRASQSPAPVFADTEEEAMKALAPLGIARSSTRRSSIFLMRPRLGQLVWRRDRQLPAGHRYIADNMFTSASAEELLPGIRNIIETMPPHPSHFIFTGWKTSQERADMVYGVEDEVYLALYTIWQDPADDARYRDWAASNMAAMSHLATGSSLADENLCRRPARFITESNMARLDKVRAGLRPGRSIPQLDGRPQLTRAAARHVNRTRVYIVSPAWS